LLFGERMPVVVHPSKRAAAYLSHLLRAGNTELAIV
jgi:hypothetical protein